MANILKTAATPLLLSLPEENLPSILSYLTLEEALCMRLVCMHFRDIIFQSKHHLLVDCVEDEGSSGEGTDTALSSRRMMNLLQTFTRLRSLRLVGLRLTYDALVRGRNGAAASPRHICSLLQEAECAQSLEQLELSNVSEIPSDGSEWGAASHPSFSLHAELRLERLQKLAIKGRFSQVENPLVHSLLRASRRITHLNLAGCTNLGDYDFDRAIMEPLGGTLKHLNLSDSGVWLPRIRSATLRSLTLQRCRNLRTMNAQSRCPRLELLDLRSCPPFHGEGLLDSGSGLADICPRLGAIDLGDCTGLNFVKIGFPTHKANGAPSPSSAEPPIVMKWLERIGLRGCVHLTSATAWCPSLKHIELGQCLHLKALSVSSSALKDLDLSRLPLVAMSLRCPSLLRLNIARCCNLEIKRSFVECEALEHVDIHGATFITPNFFDDCSRKSILTIKQ